MQLILTLVFLAVAVGWGAFWVWITWDDLMGPPCIFFGMCLAILTGAIAVGGTIGLYNAAGATLDWFNQPAVSVEQE